MKRVNGCHTFLQIKAVVLFRLFLFNRRSGWFNSGASATMQPIGVHFSICRHQVLPFELRRDTIS